jgi:hypothetical protein
MQNLTILLSLVLGLQAGAFRTHTTSNFRIRYERSVPSENARLLGKALESAYAAQRKKLTGFTLGKVTDVQVFGAVGRFRAESQSKVFDDGDVRGGKLYFAVLPETTSGENLQQVAARLIAKCLLEKVITCPRWLAEGYSLYEGGDLERFGLPANTSISGFEDLAEEYSRLEVRQGAKELYAKLACTIKFFVDRYGEKKLESAIVKFRESASVEQVFESSFGEKYSDIEKAWVSALRSPPRE